MKRGLIILGILLLCSGCAFSVRAIEVPKSSENCYFKYTAAIGDDGTAPRCIMTGSAKGSQMYCGDDTHIVEVIESEEVCE